MKHFASEKMAHKSDLKKKTATGHTTRLLCS